MSPIRVLIGIAAAAALCSPGTDALGDLSAQGQPFFLQQTVGLGFTANAANTLFFGQFDDLGGTHTLQRVTFMLFPNATVSQTGGTINYSGNPGVDVTVTMDPAQVAVGAPGADPILADGMAALQVPLSPGSPASPSVNSIPPFGAVLPGAVGEANQSLIPYIGKGVVFVPVFGTARTTVAQPTLDVMPDVTSLVNYQWSGFLTMTYEYEVIPAPASLLLASPFVVGLVLREAWQRLKGA